MTEYTDKIVTTMVIASHMIDDEGNSNGQISIFADVVLDTMPILIGASDASVAYGRLQFGGVDYMVHLAPGRAWLRLARLISAAETLGPRLERLEDLRLAS